MKRIFEWDTEKEQENIRKHGVTFVDAEYVFDDPLQLERHDDEDRWQTLGFYNEILFVVYTERGDVTRIISARIAEPFERRIYYGNSKTHSQGWYRVYR